MEKESTTKAKRRCAGRVGGIEYIIVAACAAFAVSPKEAKQLTPSGGDFSIT